MSLADVHFSARATGTGAFAILMAMPSAPTSWAQSIQEDKIVGLGAGQLDEFGGAVALEGDVAIVGAAGDPSDEAAYVFRRNGSNWVQEEKVSHPSRALGTEFGAAVDVYGDVAVVGAPDDSGVVADTGAAHVYRYDGQDWLLEATLIQSDGDANDGFGRGVAVHQDVIVCGAIGHRVDGMLRGAVYIYRYDSNSEMWSLEEKILGPSFDPRTGLTNYGHPVVLDGDVAAVGAQHFSSSQAPGSVFVYRNAGGSRWSEEAVLVGSGATPTGSFGKSLALRGDVLAVGDSEYSGAVYVFRKLGSWTEEGMLTVPLSSPGATLGDAVAVGSDVVVAGADFAEACVPTPISAASGSAFQFSHDGLGWYWDETLCPDDIDNGDFLGRAVAAHGKRVLLGAPGKQFVGAAYVFERGRTKVPLGGSVAVSDGCDPGLYRVYVPTRWGGRLTVQTTAGSIAMLEDPNGDVYANGSEIGEERHGWYTFEVTGAAAYAVSTTFVQEGVASTVPWHFYYFPYGSSVGTQHLFDTPGACTKFDAALGLGTATFDWESDLANEHKDPMGSDAWWGHCWGASIASIVLEQPVDGHPDGFTQDELEGLAAEFFDNENFRTRGLLRITADEVGERATAADTDVVDGVVDRFHKVIRDQLLCERRAFHIDLRKTTGATGDPEIWNQGCFKYVAEMVEEPNAAGDPLTEKILQIRVTNTFACNADFAPSSGDPISDPMSRREQRTEYTLVFKEDGTVMPEGNLEGVKQNWISMELTNDASGPVLPPREVYAPCVMSDVGLAAKEFVGGPNQGANPHVTSERLMQLGLVKNEEFQR